ncbi:MULTISPECIES: ABC transporter permease [unclassified Brevundimonas]|uniref:ABC transporter permease n=1 Tax=unclassified Brevundimonas TaxID=2622653 RepID=UPI0025BB1F10|nr:MULTISPECIES: ABC transporter permease [unclassified Brevundimonas]
MNRALLIAQREIMAYVKTVGFWLSLLSLPFFAVLGGFMPSMLKRAEPVQQYVLLDESAPSSSLADSVRRVLEADHARATNAALSIAAVGEGGLQGRDSVRAAVVSGGYEAGYAQLQKVAPRAAASFKPPRQQTLEVKAPADLAAASTPAARDALARKWLESDELIEGRKLSTVVILDEKGGVPSARIWSRRASDVDMESKIREALSEVNQNRVFTANGVDTDLIRAVEEFRPEVTFLSPRAASGGEVSLRDRLPAFIGVICGFLMWSLILTGASMLMNGVMEEKSNKILEVLLSSVTPTELLVGKVLGVAVLTLTVMGGWGLISAVGLTIALPDVARDIGSVMLANGLWLYLLLYLVGGYLMYAVLFAAIGAFCETPRDAQTLMGPVMMAMIVPLLFVQMAMRSPDAMLLKVFSFIPPFTPFIMSARAPSQPPMVEVVGSLVVMFLFAALMMWLSGRAFRAGAMSDAKLSWKSFLGAMRTQ